MAFASSRRELESEERELEETEFAPRVPLNVLVKSPAGTPPAVGCELRCPVRAVLGSEARVSAVPDFFFLVLVRPPACSPPPAPTSCASSSPKATRRSMSADVPSTTRQMLEKRLCCVLVYEALSHGYMRP